MRLAIIVPVLNEAAQIESCLTELAGFRQRGAHVVVVDGGSSDATVSLAAPLTDRLIIRALSNSRAHWGRFDVKLQGRSPGLGLVGSMMNLRSRATGICTGDQAIFVEQGAFLALDGFAPIALMEDVEFCRRARRLSAPVALRPPVVVSARRWEQAGLARTVLQMWWLRLAYFMGADPQQLAQRYRNAR